MAENTTILVSKKQRKELDSFKDHPRETYGDVINKLIFIAKESNESRLELSSEALKAVEEGRKDFKQGRFYSTEQLRKELGFWMALKILWSEKAKKDLAKMDKNTALRIIEKLKSANENGFLFLEKIQGRDFFKYRVGKYRLFIDKLSGNEEIIVNAIMPRKNAYKNL